MWLIRALTFITLETVLAKNVLRNSDDSLEVIQLQDRAIDYLDTGIENRDLHWPLGIISYYIDPNSYDHLIVESIRLAMNSIEEASCVRFEPLREPFSETHWIHITNKARVRDCIHEPEFNGTGVETIMTLGIDCLQRRDILHLLMHALGFKDEVTHPKRDQYVRILWDNINPAYHSLFRIRHEDFPTRTTEYDPMSIMHFHDRAYTKNGQATIASLIPGLVINPSQDLSPLDKMKLRLMFGHECNRRKVGDLLDTCKTAMQEAGSREEENNSDNKPEADVDNRDNTDGEDVSKANGITGENGDGNHEEQIVNDSQNRDYTNGADMNNANSMNEENGDRNNGDHADGEDMNIANATDGEDVDGNHEEQLPAEEYNRDEEKNSAPNSAVKV